MTRWDALRQEARQLSPKIGRSHLAGSSFPDQCEKFLTGEVLHDAWRHDLDELSVLADEAALYALLAEDAEEALALPEDEPFPLRGAEDLIDLIEYNVKRVAWSEVSNELQYEYALPDPGSVPLPRLERTLPLITNKAA